MGIMDNYNLRIDKIIDIFGDMMLKDPNIVGVGRGNKIINGKMTDEPVLGFMVAKKISSSKMERDRIIPKYIKGVKTDVFETGEFKLDEGSSDDSNSDEYISRQTSQNEDKPAYGGGCISFKLNGVVKKSTLTYAVTEKGTRKSIFGLASAHTFEVLFPEFKRFIDVYYSKHKDPESVKKAWVLGITEKLGSNRNRFGENGYKYYTDINAILFYVGENSLKTRQLYFRPGFFKQDGDKGIEVIQGIEVPTKNATCYKVGLSTGYTEGKILYTNTKVKSRLNNEDPNSELIMMTNQVVANNLSKAGDSGALGVLTGTKKAFGMLNGGNEKYTVYSNISNVLDNLGIELLV